MPELPPAKRFLEVTLKEEESEEEKLEEAPGKLLKPPIGGIYIDVLMFMLSELLGNSTKKDENG